MNKIARQESGVSSRTPVGEKGMSRFQVTGRDADRALLRAIARRLAEGGADAERLRFAILQSTEATPVSKGGIIKALLASPLIGSELDMSRPDQAGREVDL